MFSFLLFLPEMAFARRPRSEELDTQRSDERPVRRLLHEIV